MNPYPIGSTLHWSLEKPIESELKYFPAVIENAGIEMHHTNVPIYVMSVDASESSGAHWAIGGIPEKHAERVIQDAKDCFGVNDLNELAGMRCLLGIWHGRSVAVKNPKTGQMHFP